MKRSIIIICLVAVMLGLSIGELIVHNRFYTRAYDDLVAVQEYIRADRDNLAESEALVIVDALIERFDKNRWLLMSLSNHSLVLMGLEHITRLREEIALGRFEEATVQVSVSIVHFEDLVGDISPGITNIL